MQMPSNSWRLHYWIPSSSSYWYPFCWSDVYSPNSTATDGAPSMFIYYHFHVTSAPHSSDCGSYWCSCCIWNNGYLKVVVKEQHFLCIMRQHHQSIIEFSPHPYLNLTLTPRPLSPSCTLFSGTSTPLPMEVFPELAISSNAQLEQLNHTGGGKEYQCQLCIFWHTNKDCMLTHVCQHLVITISCPMCGEGFPECCIP